MLFSWIEIEVYRSIFQPKKKEEANLDIFYQIFRKIQKIVITEDIGFIYMLLYYANQN